MQPPRNNPRPASAQVIRLFGRDYPVLERLTLGRRSYLLLEQLTVGERERYLAFDPNLAATGRPVLAVRLSQSVLHRQHLETLRRAGRPHDALPQIVDYRVFPADQAAWIVLTWVEGETLAERIAAARTSPQRAISPPVAVQRIRQLAHGLRRLNKQLRLVHGDIKPSNIVIARDSGRFVLIDYGTAWCAERTTRRDLGDGISAVYAAPEQQVVGSLVDCRCDQFGLSAVLYELLTGECPYDGLGGKAGRPEYRDQFAGCLRPPSQSSPFGKELPRTVWKSVDQLVTRGLELNADDRFPTPEAWLDALDVAERELISPAKLSGVTALLTDCVSSLATLMHRFRRGTKG